MKLWPALLVFMTGCTASASSYSELDAVALHIQMEQGSCSATAVGPHTILTADHCLTGTKLVAVNGVPVKVLRVERDGSDHALIKVDMKFAKWAKFGTPLIGERVRLLGNPTIFRKVYREGIVSARNLMSCPTLETVTPRPSCEVLVFQLVVGMGDSGAGYFDDTGRLVAVHSASFPIVADVDGDKYGYLPVALALAFTPAQWKAAGV